MKIRSGNITSRAIKIPSKKPGLNLWGHFNSSCGLNSCVCVCECFVLLLLLLLLLLVVGGREEREYTLFGKNSSFLALGLFLRKYVRWTRVHCFGRQQFGGMLVVQLLNNYHMGSF